MFMLPSSYFMAVSIVSMLLYMRQSGGLHENADLWPPVVDH